MSPNYSLRATSGPSEDSTCPTQWWWGSLDILAHRNLLTCRITAEPCAKEMLPQKVTQEGSVPADIPFSISLVQGSYLLHQQAAEGKPSPPACSSTGLPVVIRPALLLVLPLTESLDSLQTFQYEGHVVYFTNVWWQEKKKSVCVPKFCTERCPCAATAL